MQRLVQHGIAGLVAGIAGSFVMNQMLRACFGVRQEPAAMRVAETLGAGSPRAAEAVHYAVGALGGIVYGAAAPVFPPVTAGRGSLFGLGVWLLNEVAMPLSGLSRIAVAEPRFPRLASMATHLAYGLTADAIRRAMQPLVLR